MPPGGRLGDNGQVPLDAHGCPACPHPAIGPATKGSPSVNINKVPALRVSDNGVHAACCGPNIWVAKQGSPNVFFNNLAAHRLGDSQQHCGGMGKLVAGSPNVMINGGGGSGGGGGGGGGADSGGGGDAQADAEGGENDPNNPDNAPDAADADADSAEDKPESVQEQMAKAPKAANNPFAGKDIWAGKQKIKSTFDGWVMFVLPAPHVSWDKLAADLNAGKVKANTNGSCCMAMDAIDALMVASWNFEVASGKSPNARNYSVICYGQKGTPRVPPPGYIDMNPIEGGDGGGDG